MLEQDIVRMQTTIRGPTGLCALFELQSTRTLGLSKCGSQGLAHEGRWLSSSMLMPFVTTARREQDERGCTPLSGDPTGLFASLEMQSTRILLELSSSESLLTYPISKHKGLPLICKMHRFCSTLSSVHSAVTQPNRFDDTSRESSVCTFF
jgi:hypothetical protein